MATVGVRHFQMFIDGEHVDSDETQEVVNPANEEVFATVAVGTAEHADRAVEAARRAFEKGEWSRKTPADRAAVMTAIADRLGDEMEELVELETGANGATMRQAMGFHVGYAAPHFLYFAELAATFEWERAVPTPAYPTLSMNTIRHEPLGVCAAIVPFNFPLLLGIWKIGPALAAGNSVVVKPDEKAPLSLLKLVEICHECGVPPGVINLVMGPGADVGARLASHPEVDKVGFTGSTQVGREIMKLASGTVKKVSLELGGKNPQVLLDDADLDVAIDGALFASMLYSGQICMSGTRLLVPSGLHDEVVERLVARAKTLKLGDPQDFDTDLGPVISGAQRDKLLGFFGRAVEAGATSVLGGGVPDGPEFERGYWIEPTIFTDVTQDMEIACEETFGPVLVVIRYDGDADAIAKANDTQYGLTAGVWSTDFERAIDVGQKLKAGTVWVNNWHAISPQLPFGGYKQSGLGRELGLAALTEYTETKHLHVDLTQSVDGHIFDALLSEPG